MKKNFINFLFGKKDANVSNINNNDNNDDDNGCIDCECNITKIPFSKSLEIKEIKKDNTKEEENDREEEEQEELQKAKFLIILGIALTIPLVIIEIFYHEHTTITDYILLGLATPVQLILGKPFYTKILLFYIKKEILYH